MSLGNTAKRHKNSLVQIDQKSKRTASSGVMKNGIVNSEGVKRIIHRSNFS